MSTHICTLSNRPTLLKVKKEDRGQLKRLEVLRVGTGCGNVGLCLSTFDSNDDHEVVNLDTFQQIVLTRNQAMLLRNEITEALNLLDLK